MELQLCTVLLVSVCALSSWSVSSGTFVVTQSPDTSVMEWEAANITCCWTENVERVTVNWLKHRKHIKSEPIICQGPMQEDQCKCSTLILQKLSRLDSGTYVCRVSVEIPVHTVVEGDGINLTVIARGSTDAVTGSRIVISVADEDGSSHDITFETTSGAAPRGDALLHVLRCLPVLALILTFFYLYNTGTRLQPQAPAAPENNQSPVQTTEQQKEKVEEEKEVKEEQRTETETEKEGRDEE